MYPVYTEDTHQQQLVNLHLVVVEMNFLWPFLMEAFWHHLTLFERILHVSKITQKDTKDLKISFYTISANWLTLSVYECKPISASWLCWSIIAKLFLNTLKLNKYKIFLTCKFIIDILLFLPILFFFYIGIFFIMNTFK